MNHKSKLAILVLASAPFATLACDPFDLIDAKTFMDGGSIELDVKLQGKTRVIYVDNSLALSSTGLAPQLRLDGVVHDARSEEMQRIRADLKAWLKRVNCEEVVDLEQVGDALFRNCMLAEGVVQLIDLGGS